MNDIDLLTRAVEAEPRNTIIAAMLTDELMEARDMLRSEADRHVAAVQRVAGAARQVTLAVELMETGTRSQRQLTRRLRGPRVSARVRLDDPHRTGRRPRVWFSAIDEQGTLGIAYYIAVGAGTVLKLWDAGSGLNTEKCVFIRSRLLPVVAARPSCRDGYTKTHLTQNTTMNEHDQRNLSDVGLAELHVLTVRLERCQTQAALYQAERDHWQRVADAQVADVESSRQAVAEARAHWRPGR